MAWVAKLLPKEEYFFPLFEEHAERIALAADALQAVLSERRAIEDGAQKITQLCRDGSANSRRILDGVRSTFVTPFNRIDIKDLIVGIDECLAHIRKTTRAIALFETRPFDPEMRRLGETIGQCGALVQQAVPLLSNIDREAKAITDLCGRIGALIEEASDASLDALRALLKRSPLDPIDYITRSAVYDLLDAVLEDFKKIANHLHDLVIDQV